jgi:hypothetical protein
MTSSVSVSSSSGWMTRRRRGGDDLHGLLIQLPGPGLCFFTLPEARATLSDQMTPDATGSGTPGSTWVSSQAPMRRSRRGTSDGSSPGCVAAPHCSPGGSRRHWGWPRAVLRLRPLSITNVVGELASPAPRLDVDPNHVLRDDAIAQNRLALADLDAAQRAAGDSKRQLSASLNESSETGAEQRTAGCCDDHVLSRR